MVADNPGNILLTSQKNTTRAYSLLAGLIILASVLVAFFTFAQKSSTVDESVHLASGYSYWATGDFRMNPEHPALVKEIAAIPLLFFHLNFDPKSPNFDQVHLWDFGPEVIYNNNASPQQLIMAGRIPLLLFLVFLGILTYAWSKKLFGEKVALVVLFLTMTCQNILAHSGLVTTDVPVTFAFLLVCFTLAQFLQNRDQKTFTWFTLALAFVLLVKFSAVVVVVALIVIMATHSLLHTKQGKKLWNSYILHDFLKNKILPLVVAGILSFVFFVFAYGGGFKTVYNGTDSASAEVVHDFVDHQPEKLRNALNWIGNNVPFPAYDYIEGMALVLTHNKGGHTVFFLGEVSNRGWWYYFPTVFLFKTSLSHLLLFVSVLALGITKLIFFVRKEKYRFSSIYTKLQTINFEYIILVLAPLIFFAFGMRSRLNLGVRYVLPVYPFLFILSGFVIQHFFRTKMLRAVLVLFLAASLYETVTVFPNYLSYYNPLAYGNGVTPLHISNDSNLDWGQDLPALKKYMDKNHIDSVYFRYFGTADPAAYGINVKPYFPTEKDIVNGQDVSGYVVVSATALSAPEEGYAWPLLHKPVAVINGSLYVFRFDHLK